MGQIRVSDDAVNSINSSFSVAQTSITGIKSGFINNWYKSQSEAVTGFTNAYENSLLLLDELALALQTDSAALNKLFLSFKETDKKNSESFR